MHPADETTSSTDAAASARKCTDFTASPRGTLQALSEATASLDLLPSQLDGIVDLLTEEWADPAKNASRVADMVRIARDVLTRSIDQLTELETALALRGAAA